jgi:hypothetical protein
MSDPPANPKICHITHVNNLPGIIESGGLWSDARRLELGLATSLIGMSRIKQRRLTEIEVCCHPGTMVGQYVPFFYCPRSIMLYILDRGNHPDVDYQEGQRPIVHLVADLDASLQWAAERGVPWALSPTNAGARYASFFNQREDFNRIDWQAVANRDFRDPSVKEGKQAEFLMLNWFPWTLVEHIGVFDQNIKRTAEQAVDGATHQPPVRVQNGWYF